MSSFDAICLHADYTGENVIISFTIPYIHSFSELVSESEKVFGNDGEFFHLQQDPQEAPGFRDSGYYDGIVDTNLKSPFDVKPGMLLLSSVTKLSDNDKHDIWEKLKKEATTSDVENVVIKHTEDSPLDKLQKGNLKTECFVASDSCKAVYDKESVSDRPNTLQNVGTTDNADDKSPQMKTPVSMTSVSDSEYQSGQESLSSNSNSPTGAGTPDMESSVDTGEIFQSENNTEQPSPSGDNSDIDHTADNCTIS